MKMGPQDTVWITGAAGRMGQAIEHFLDHSRYKVMTSDIEIDVSNLHEVLNFAESYRPDFVINCAALASRTEADENPDKAYKVNALGARNLAIASNNVGAKSATSSNITARDWPLGRVVDMASSVAVSRRRAVGNPSSARAASSYRSCPWRPEECHRRRPHRPASTTWRSCPAGSRDAPACSRPRLP